VNDALPRRGHSRLRLADDTRQFGRLHAAWLNDDTCMSCHFELRRKRRTQAAAVSHYQPWAPHPVGRGRHRWQPLPAGLKQVRLVERLRRVPDRSWVSSLQLQPFKCRDHATRVLKHVHVADHWWLAGFHAQAQLELARVHAARGRPGDLPRVRTLAAAVLERADLLGMPPLAAGARALLRRAGSPSAGGLTRREREVAELVADGLTNRAIAQRFHLSERTAANHVQHILDKLGLANRSQIASFVSSQKLSSA